MSRQFLLNWGQYSFREIINFLFDFFFLNYCKLSIIKAKNNRNICFAFIFTIIFTIIFLEKAIFFIFKAEKSQIFKNIVKIFQL